MRGLPTYECARRGLDSRIENDATTPGGMKDESHDGKEVIVSAADAAMPADPARNGAARSQADEFLPLLESVLRRWPWLLMGGGALGILGVVAGLVFWK